MEQLDGSQFYTLARGLAVRSVSEVIRKGREWRLSARRGQGKKHKSELEQIRAAAPVGGDSASACAQVVRREGSVGRIRKEQPD
jgi:hypothetical protein